MNEPMRVPERDHHNYDPALNAGRSVVIGGCFGMFHPGPATEAILILPPFGHEALSSAKPLRLLAERLAAAGYPVLRLDYLGTGNSADAAPGSDAVESQAESAIEAAAWLRQLVGVSQVSVIGVRLGAANALRAASDIKPERLMLIAPVLQGKAYLREMQQMRALHSSGPLAPANAGQDEFNGFVLGQDVLARLRALDMRQAEAEFKTQAAILNPAGMAAVRGLVARWQASGKKAEAIDFCAAADLLTDPAIASTSDAFVARAANWFGAPDIVETRFWSPARAMTLASGDCTETACRFGEQGLVFGILCQPAKKNSNGRALVLVSTGGNAASGWGRQTVQLARRLAADGIATLRIDLNGVGETPDIPGRPGQIVYAWQSAREVLAAVAYLKERGYVRPDIAGICSGAFAVYHAIRLGVDIGSALMINLQKFDWREGDRLVLYASIGSYLSKLRDLSMWRRVLSGQTDTAGVINSIAGRIVRLAVSRVRNGLPGLLARFGRIFLTHKIIARDPVRQQLPRDVLQQACAGGVYVAMAYTEGDGGIDEMTSQLGLGGRLIGAPGMFAFSVIDGADHNFSSAGSREVLYPLVRDFVMSRPAREETDLMNAA